MPRAEVRALSGPLEALAQAHRGDPQVVHGAGVRGLQDALAVRERIEPEVRRDLVQLHLERVPRLRRPVTALRAAGRFVRVDADAVELVRRHAVRDRKQRARVVRGRDPVRGIRAAVEPTLEMDRGDLAILRDARLQMHLHRVPAAVGVEDLFAVEGELHRSLRAEREEARGELVRVGVAMTRIRARGTPRTFSSSRWR